MRFWLEYALLRLIAGLVRLMPLELATRLSAKCWRTLAPHVSAKRHQRALENLRIAFPHMSEDERLAIRAAHWENLGRVMVETIQIDRLARDSARFEVINSTILARYGSELGAAVGVSLHMGNWEFAIWPFVVACANPAALYRTVNNPHIDRYLREKRSVLYPGGMFARGKVEGERGDDHRTARAVTDFVRRGGRLGIVCDQHYGRGIPVRFFGRDARPQPIAAIIARRVGARLWMARCVRIGTESRFRIEIKELRVPRSANPAADIRATLAGALALLRRLLSLRVDGPVMQASEKPQHEPP
jgi:Kdo2-lipid IVA lauroyltransferase/acyltransferase